jgi:hypothetical protein
MSYKSRHAGVSCEMSKAINEGESPFPFMNNFPLPSGANITKFIEHQHYCVVCYLFVYYPAPKILRILHTHSVLVSASSLPLRRAPFVSPLSHSARIYAPFSIAPAEVSACPPPAGFRHPPCCPLCCSICYIDESHACYGYDSSM